MSRVYLSTHQTGQPTRRCGGLLHTQELGEGFYKEGAEVKQGNIRRVVAEGVALFGKAQLAVRDQLFLNSLGFGFHCIDPRL